MQIPVEIRRHDNPDTYSEEEKEELTDSLTYVAKKAFDTVYRKDVRNHIVPVSTLLVAEMNGTTVGFSATNHYLLEKENGRKDAVIYLEGTCIDRDLQGNGLYKHLNMKRLEIEMEKIRELDDSVDRVYVSTITQNPVVYKAFQQLYVTGRELKNITPDIKSEKRTHKMDCEQDFLDFFSRFEKAMGIETTGRFVHRERYSEYVKDGGMYKERPQSNVEGFDKYFNKILDYGKGDAVVLMGELI